MTTSQQSRKIRTGLAAAAAVVAALAIPGTAVPARAAVPGVAQTWSGLMRRSLTAGAEAVRLRAALAAQQTAFAARVGDLNTAKKADADAQARVTTAVLADAAARDRRTAAGQALTRARAALAKATKQKPRNKTAVTRAQNAVTAATKVLTLRQGQAVRAAAALAAANAGGAAATTGLSNAVIAWKAASVAIRQTELKIAGVGTPGVLRDRAAAISKDVVTQVRPAFTVADTTQVYGVTVNKIVAYPFQRMVDDAKAAGIPLSGGGFRTRQRQIELRTINGCPDVWTAPASSCRVPTAIPGRSLHEIGLAVDVTSGGKTLTAKSPGFLWMAAHAAAYGFVNLPAEPWHWSITGN